MIVSVTQIEPDFAISLTPLQAMLLEIAAISGSFDTDVTTLGPIQLALTAAAPVTLDLSVPGSIDWGGSGGSSAYNNPAYPLLQTTQEALDYLLYTPPHINSFANSVGTVEIGSTVSAVNLSWSFNKAMTSVTLNGSAFSPTLTSDSLSGLSLTSNTTYSLTASDGANQASASTTVAFAPRRWWGTSPLSALGSADILALGNSEFASSRGQSRVMSANAAYLWFAWPSSFGGPASFVVNGLTSSGWVRSTISHTNAAGYTQNYDCYRSQFPQNGSGINVVIS